MSLKPGIGDVVLLCDSATIKDTTLQKFCLEWKLQQLMPGGIWKSKIQGLISFLEKDFRESFKDEIKDKLPTVRLFKNCLHSSHLH